MLSKSEILSTDIVFDQYSRYRACADIIERITEDGPILDVGSGPDCLLGKFLPHHPITYVDPLIFGVQDDQNSRFSCDIFDPCLDHKVVENVCSIDTLEHIPHDRRKKFINRLSRLARHAIVLGFPCSDDGTASRVDSIVAESYQKVFGREYSWLKEHCEFVLPSRSEVITQLQELGWVVSIVGHGHAPWLSMLLGVIVCGWEFSEIKQDVLRVSQRFNEELYPYDFNPPFYRSFVVACKHDIQFSASPFGKPIDAAAVWHFSEILTDAYSSMFSLTMNPIELSENCEKGADSSLKKGLSSRLEESNSLLVEANSKVGELSVWGADLQALLEESNSLLVEANSKVTELSVRGESLQARLEILDNQGEKMSGLLEEANQEVSAKHEELMKMSDWASGMRQELERRDALWSTKLAKFVKSPVLSLRKRLARTVLGNVVRHVRHKRQSQSIRRTIDLVRQDLEYANGKLIITFPVITWDFRWQRPQHIVLGLRDHGYAVLYLAMSLIPLKRRFRDRGEALSSLRFNDLDKNVKQVWLSSAQQLNVYTDPIAEDNLVNMSLSLESLIQELKPASIHYLVQLPSWWPVVKILKHCFGGKVVFDCMDDHEGFSTSTEHARDTEKDLVAQADLVIASSTLLEQRCSRMNTNTILVRNGTEFDHFAIPQKNGALDHLAHQPIVGYYGAISDWFDMEIVAFCAMQRPDWNFVLIGSTMGANLELVKRPANIHLLGEKPYQDLPGFLSYFDVCIIPFKINSLTLATNPVKFYEYLSAGKPVVAVELPELIVYSDYCYLAKDRVEFLSQLDCALMERNDQAKIRNRIQLAKENGWSARIDDIMLSPLFR